MLKKFKQLVLKEFWKDFQCFVDEMYEAQYINYVIFFQLAKVITRDNSKSSHVQSIEDELKIDLEPQ